MNHDFFLAISEIFERTSSVDDTAYTVFSEKNDGEFPWRHCCCFRCRRNNYYSYGRLDWNHYSPSGRYVRENCKPLCVSRRPDGPIGSPHARRATNRRQASLCVSTNRLRCFRLELANHVSVRLSTNQSRSTDPTLAQRSWLWMILCSSCACLLFSSAPDPRRMPPNPYLTRNTPNAAYPYSPRKPLEP